jgi:hypothetical protein
MCSADNSTYIKLKFQFHPYNLQQNIQSCAIPQRLPPTRLWYTFKRENWDLNVRLLGLNQLPAAQEELPRKLPGTETTDYK